MDPSLLFASGYIWDGAHTLLIAAGAAMIFTGGIWYFFLRKKPAPIIRPEKMIFDTRLPDLDDADFAVHALRSLQNIVRQVYVPHNANAHTAEDIFAYCEDSHILDLWRELEQVIYQSGKPLGMHDKKILIANLRNIRTRLIG